MHKRTKEKLCSQGGEAKPSTIRTGLLSETQRIGKEGENPSEKNIKILSVQWLEIVIWES